MNLVYLYSLTKDKLAAKAKHAPFTDLSPRTTEIIASIGGHQIGTLQSIESSDMVADYAPLSDHTAYGRVEVGELADSVQLRDYVPPHTHDFNEIMNLPASFQIARSASQYGFMGGNYEVVITDSDGSTNVIIAREVIVRPV